MLSRNPGHTKIHSGLRDNRLSVNKHSRRGKTSITNILNLWKIELEEVTRIWKGGLLYTLIGKINIIKNDHSTKTILQIQCNLNKKHQWHYSLKQKKDPKIYVEQQKITESQINPEQKNKVGGISILDFKT